MEKMKLKRQDPYIDGNDTWGILSVDRCTGKELGFPIFTQFKLEENLLLSNFGEVEFTIIEWLEDLINTKLCRSFLKVTAFIQLCYEAILSRNNLITK